MTNTNGLSRVDHDNDHPQDMTEVLDDVERRRGFRQVHVTVAEVIAMIREADKALDGNSNDAEHDALYSVRESLADLLERP